LCDPENVQSVLSELSELDMEKLLVKKLEIFSMNLLAKHHVLSSTVQTVMSETYDLLNHSMSFMLDKIESVLANASVAQQVISSVTKTLQNHPLSCAFDSQSGPLRSEAARASFYKNMYNYV
jgi:hypothetical protein